jgi:hypothetical protein
MSISRFASLLVVAGHAVAAFAHAGGDARLWMAVPVAAFPLALIWFPELFADYVGPERGGYIAKKSPPVPVAPRDGSSSSACR